jgi:hypothetical protein
LSNIKYLGIGLLIGILIASVGIAGIFFLSIKFSPEPITVTSVIPTGILILPSGTPTQPPKPTSTFTFTPTAYVPSIVILDPAIQETATPDVVTTTINSGGLIFTGSLSNAEQISLYRSSLNYIEPTVKDSVIKALEINAVGYGDPSNICGPLAIAIMQDAGLLSKRGLVPHDFWLLDPMATGDQKILERVFPPDHYLHIKFTTPINKTNWRIFPLQPGDFLFIWHGSGGNFDHMLVVTRVDANLDPFTVTNFGTAQGFVIAETMIYNPSDPNVGIFHTWTQERDAILGSTGFGGFEVWRPLNP